ncbi:MAG TPA: hypothetical protein VNE63_12370 [Candidatus Acidoferrales bacterium]|nr:hypothetical protein [Candidatus Acidoferrales bacterium]
MRKHTRCHTLLVRCATALLAIATCGSAVKATTLMRMSVAELSHAAQVIVRAHCVSNSTRWDANEIWTFTAFSVDEVWRGSPAPQIMVRLLGGRSGNLTSHVSGIPRFRPGEDVVLFLAPTRHGDFSVVSWEQGTFRIRHGIHAGGETVLQDTASFATFDPATREFETQGIRDMPLVVFRAQVEASLHGGAGRTP